MLQTIADVILAQRQAEAGVILSARRAEMQDDLIARRITALDLEKEFRASKTPYAELDDGGQPVVRRPGEGDES